MRILVTGSRDWSDATAVLLAVSRELFKSKGATEFRIVHGACPTGADAIASRWVADMNVGVPLNVPVVEERHPADWSQGRKAGPERNRHMVELGADVCLAFIGDCTSPRCHRQDPHPSHGASGCAALAESAGIPTRRFYPKDRT